ncbi:hypothetical protein OG288_29315 [Streptomyces tauricus]|uniref:Uncharacterized protein n=1 Tax=Streptomyces tauricus TaxID=68274 RepID=A0ABZ1JPN6_9ACTN|nr:hypothetical protein [Streptomyces tauricus]
MVSLKALLAALIALTLTLIVTILTVVLTGDVADAIVQGVTTLIAATSLGMVTIQFLRDRD